MSKQALKYIAVLLLACLCIGLKCEKQSEQQVKPMLLLPKQIEVNCTFDLKPGVNTLSFRVWANDVIAKIADANGCLSCHSSHNMLDSPRVKWESWWKTIDDWATFTAGDYWQRVLSDLHYEYAVGFDIDIWTPDKYMFVLFEKETKPIVKPDTE